MQRNAYQSLCVKVVHGKQLLFLLFAEQFFMFFVRREVRRLCSFKYEAQEQNKQNILCNRFIVGNLLFIIVETVAVIVTDKDRLKPYT